MGLLIGAAVFDLLFTLMHTVPTYTDNNPSGKLKRDSLPRAVLSIIYSLRTLPLEAGAPGAYCGQFTDIKPAMPSILSSFELYANLDFLEV